MGCHTYFYEKIEPQPTKEEIKDLVAAALIKNIEFWQKMIHGDIDSKLMDAYPEWTIEYGSYYRAIDKRRLRMINAGHCVEATYNKYCESYYSLFGKLTHKSKANKFYIETVYSDVFRKGGYPDIELTSLKETLDYINNPENYCQTYEWTNKRLEEFWNKHPNGLICFG